MQEYLATWTRGRLTSNFQHTPYFVGQVSPLPSLYRCLVQANTGAAHAANREMWMSEGGLWWGLVDAVLVCALRGFRAEGAFVF